MLNKKKSFLLINGVLSLAVTGHVAAELPAESASKPTATVTWSGVVPATVPQGSNIITGLNGSLDALTGALSPSRDGKFQSPEIILESRAIDTDDTSGAESIGALVDTNWTLVSSGVTYGGAGVNGAVLKVYFNGTEIAPGNSTTTKSKSIAVRINQTTDLTSEGVGGKTAQAAVTVMINPS